jgi:hypothetical protein
MVDFWRGEFIFFKTRLKFLSGQAARLNRSQDFEIGIEVAFCGQNVGYNDWLKTEHLGGGLFRTVLASVHRSSLSKNDEQVGRTSKPRMVYMRESH